MFLIYIYNYNLSFLINRLNLSETMFNSIANTLSKLISLDNFNELAVATTTPNINNRNTSNNNNENNNNEHNKRTKNYITTSSINIIGKWLRNKGNNLMVFQCDMYGNDGLSLILCLCEFINSLLVIVLRMKRYLALILWTVISSICMSKDHLVSQMSLKKVNYLQLNSADVAAPLFGYPITDVCTLYFNPQNRNVYDQNYV